ncbi:magnesium/cobalt transporter CorA [Crenobacter sp. SG2303]|uniref:Magnesium transport protein CorA n=1 Tax=Crenobacter oryzisoli TaxID=3056844 RepID=A0ABT7XSQ2_9NEIS|nr:magnesium/cobalt transporter CorA [Crenobacter sp. SG2303]MDN0076760.1 magnesium/cobalt transporter CorA [Crenobacter sp. SG2303]
MLINCAAYQDGKKLADITQTAIRDYLVRPDCFVWVALKDPEPSELEAMSEEFGLHELAVEDALRGHQLAKIEEYGEMLFVVLHLLELDPSGQVRTGEVAVFVGANYVLSIRSRSDLGFLGVRARCEREPQLLRFGAGFVLYALMDAVVDRYFPVITALEQELDAIEERMFTKGSSSRNNIEALYELKRKLMLVQHSISPLEDAVGKLLGGRVPQVCVGLHEYYRDIYDHLERVVKHVEAIRDMLNTAIQVNLSLVSLDDSTITKKFAAYGALFAAPTLIAGVYGMNFKDMPELQLDYGYPVAIVVMLLLDVLLWWRFKRANWI